MASEKDPRAATSAAVAMAISLRKVPLGQADEIENEPHIRADWRGASRASLGASEILAGVGRARGVGSYFPYAAIDEGLNTGTYFMVPTTKDDPDKIRLRWIDGGKTALFTLRRFFKVTGHHVPRGMAWSIPCGAANVGDGPALELILPKGRQGPTETRSAAETTPPEAPVRTPAPQ